MERNGVTRVQEGIPTHGGYPESQPSPAAGVAAAAGAAVDLQAYAKGFADEVVADFKLEAEKLLADLKDPETVRLAVTAANNVALYTGLATIDPENRERYKQNAAHAMNTLQSLSAEHKIEISRKLRQAIEGVLYKATSFVLGAAFAALGVPPVAPG